MKDLGKKIKEYREDNDMSQKELAIQMNVSIKTIQRYEDGTTIPSPSTLKQLGDILGQSLIKQDGSISESELIDLVLQNNAMISVSLDAMAELLSASNPKKTVTEARSSLAKAVEHRLGILKESSRS
jgi:transcriptional regulator with XRE-family HTH domain